MLQKGVTWVSNLLGMMMRAQTHIPRGCPIEHITDPSCGVQWEGKKRRVFAWQASAWHEDTSV